MNSLKKELIKKHIEFGNGDFFHASVKSYETTGRASGSFFMALKDMMDEYAERLAVGQNRKCCESLPKDGFYLGTTCPKCNKPFRH